MTFVSLLTAIYCGMSLHELKAYLDTRNNPSTADDPKNQKQGRANTIDVEKGTRNGKKRKTTISTIPAPAPPSLPFPPSPNPSRSSSDSNNRLVRPMRGSSLSSYDGVTATRSSTLATYTGSVQIDSSLRPKRRIWSSNLDPMLVCKPTTTCSPLSDRCLDWNNDNRNLGIRLLCHHERVATRTERRLE